jgi:hypothetical protein
VTCNKTFKFQIGVICALRKYRIKIQRYLQKGKRTSGRHQNTVPRQQWAQGSQESICTGIWGEMGGHECEMCTENDKEGSG